MTKTIRNPAWLGAVVRHTQALRLCLLFGKQLCSMLRSSMPSGISQTRHSSSSGFTENALIRETAGLVSLLVSSDPAADYSAATPSEKAIKRGGTQKITQRITLTDEAIRKGSSHGPGDRHHAHPSREALIPHGLPDNLGRNQPPSFASLPPMQSSFHALFLRYPVFKSQNPQGKKRFQGKETAGFVALGYGLKCHKISWKNGQKRREHCPESFRWFSIFA